VDVEHWNTECQEYTGHDERHSERGLYDAHHEKHQRPIGKNNFWPELACLGKEVASDGHDGDIDIDIPDQIRWRQRYPWNEADQASSYEHGDREHDARRGQVAFVSPTTHERHRAVLSRRSPNRQAE
jgi:hypothetical protein